MQAQITRSDPRLRLVAIAAAVLAVAGMFGVGQRWFTHSTPVSAEEAVSEYRQEAQAGRGSVRGSDASANPERAAVGVPVESNTAPSPASQDTRVGGDVGESKAAEQPLPRSGVYTYRTTGYEQAGFRRNYPAETQRIIDVRPDGSWGNHHIYSAEHEEWFGLEWGDAGLLMQNRRNKITFGLISVDRNMVFTPQVLNSPLPHELGRTWKGSWSGPTRGTYTGKTFDHSTMRVDGQDVEVWADELTLQFEGENQGNVNMKIWFSPVHAVALKEEIVATVKAGPLDAHTESLLLLKSLRPKT